MLFMLFTEDDQKRLDFLKLCIRKYNHTNAKMLQYWNWMCNNALCISVPCHLSDAVFLLYVEKYVLKAKF